MNPHGWESVGDALMDAGPGLVLLSALIIGWALWVNHKDDDQ